MSKLSTPLLTSQQLKPILDEIGAETVQLLRNRIRKQTEVGGSPFPPLKPATEERKHKIGGGVAGNADKRMKATNDFVNNAYQYRVENDGVTISISDKPHKQLKIKARRQARRTNKKKGWNVSAKAPKQSSFSYRDLASWQLRGKFDQGLRKSGNPGADFFGFSKSDEEKINKICADKIKPLIEANIVKAIKESCR